MKNSVNPIEINEEILSKIEDITETENLKNSSLSSLTLSVTKLLTFINTKMEYTDYLQKCNSDTKEDIYDAYRKILESLKFAMVYVVDGKNMFLKNAKKIDYIPDENYMKSELAYELNMASSYLKMTNVMLKGNNNG